MNVPSLFLLVPIADVVARYWDPPVILIAKLVTVGALVIMNGFFVVAEFALVKIRDSQLKTLADEGVRQAVLVKQIRDNLNAYLSACQVGITAASLGLGWLGEPFLARMLQPFFAFNSARNAAYFFTVARFRSLRLIQAVLAIKEC